MAVLKIHGHPTGHDRFSSEDDESDRHLLRAADGFEPPVPVLSAYLLPSGLIRARLLGATTTHRVDRVVRVGDRIEFHDECLVSPDDDPVNSRTRQAFGDATVEALRRMRVGVVGVSGTGGWVVEMLHRLGVRELVLVDPDSIEDCNLNRIVNSRRDHAAAGARKVEAIRDALVGTGLGATIEAIPRDAANPAAIRSIASCDVVFGCVDSPDGRDLLNRIATFYTIPYIDVGVRIDADGRGGVSQVLAAVHYLIPGGSSLLSRRVISAEQVTSAAMRRSNPDQYAERRREGYVLNAEVPNPAVISVNGFVASAGVNELLARLHGFRRDDDQCRYQVFALHESSWLCVPDGDPCRALAPRVGRGDVNPMLDDPTIGDGGEA